MRSGRRTSAAIRRRYTLNRTHKISANNWGAYAGASRIAADLYLGDDGDLAAAAKVTRGFLGDRAAVRRLRPHNLESDDLSWSCSGSRRRITPVNRCLHKSGINLDGGVVADISRGGSLTWPPPKTGVQYQLESIQGLGLQVELLYRNGYANAWAWSDSALKRMAGLVTPIRRGRRDRLERHEHASRQMPWLLNERYGTSIPTSWSGMGRGIGFTDWLYGNGGGGSAGAQARPSPSPRRSRSRSRRRPAVAAIRSSTRRTCAWPRRSTPRWPACRPSSSGASPGSLSGLRRYDLQYKRDGGAWTKAVAHVRPARDPSWVTLVRGHTYTFRVRAVDKAGRVGEWKTVGPRLGASVSDASALITWKGKWAAVKLKTYLGRRGPLDQGQRRHRHASLQGDQRRLGRTGRPTRGKAKVYLDGKLVDDGRPQDGRVPAPSDRVRGEREERFPHARHQGARYGGRPTVAIDAIYVVAPS